MATYQLLEEWLELSELGRYSTYGVRRTEGERIVEIHDVSTHKQTVLQLITLLEKESVSEDHFMDVLEDFMVEAEWGLETPDACQKHFSEPDIEKAVIGMPQAYSVR